MSAAHSELTQQTALGVPTPSPGQVALRWLALSVAFLPALTLAIGIFIPAMWIYIWPMMAVAVVTLVLERLRGEKHRASNTFNHESVQILVLACCLWVFEMAWATILISYRNGGRLDVMEAWRTVLMPPLLVLWVVLEEPTRILLAAAAWTWPLLVGLAALACSRKQSAKGAGIAFGVLGTVAWLVYRLY